MAIEHILTEIMNRPLFITPDKLSVIMSVLSKKSGSAIPVDLGSMLPALGSDKNGDASMAAARQVQSSERKSIAVIGALGSLTYRNAGNPGAGSGLVSYRSLTTQVKSCLRDESIGGMMIDFNSYGGSAQGCERMARFLKEADGQKPIYAIVDMNCFSAAYYLASACRKIILTDADCGVGSIGCIAIHRDESKRNEMEGDRYTAAYFGARKNDLSPHEPLSDESYRRLKQSVDSFGLQFVATVAEFRGLSVTKIEETEAGVYYGKNAIDAGLADLIATFDEAQVMLAQEIEGESTNTIYGGSSMSMTTQQRMEALLGAEDGAEAIAALGYSKGAEVNEQAVEEAVAKALQKNLSVREEIISLCQLGDLDPTATLSIVTRNLGVEEAREAIQATKAKKAQESVVNSNITPTAASGKNPLIAAAEKLAGIK